MKSLRAWFFIATAFFVWRTASADDSALVDYNQDIRPILSNVCYKCHGPGEGERQAELRFDIQAAAFAERGGKPGIVPGKSDASHLYLRLIAEDPDERMPPSDSDKELTSAQIDLIKRWIDQGAKWGEHWSFVRPVRTESPTSQFDALAKNAIDRFIFTKLEQAGLSPNGEAAKERLIRRVTFDLTGLPPTLEEINAFLADDSPQGNEAFESFAVWKQVQRTTENGLPKPLQEILKLEEGKATEAQTKQLLAHFVENVYTKTRALFAPLHKQLAGTKKQLDDLDKSIPATLPRRRACKSSMRLRASTAWLAASGQTRLRRRWH